MPDVQEQIDEANTAAGLEQAPEADPVTTAENTPADPTLAASDTDPAPGDSSPQAASSTASITAVSGADVQAIETRAPAPVSDSAIVSTSEFEKIEAAVIHGVEIAKDEILQLAHKLSGLSVRGWNELTEFERNLRIHAAGLIKRAEIARAANAPEGSV